MCGRLTVSVGLDVGVGCAVGDALFVLGALVDVGALDDGLSVPTGERDVGLCDDGALEVGCLVVGFKLECAGA